MSCALIDFFEDKVHRAGKLTGGVAQAQDGYLPSIDRRFDGAGVDLAWIGDELLGPAQWLFDTAQVVGRVPGGWNSGPHPSRRLAQSLLREVVEAIVMDLDVGGIAVRVHKLDADRTPLAERVVEGHGLLSIPGQGIEEDDWLTFLSWRDRLHDGSVHSLANLVRFPDDVLDALEEFVVVGCPQPECRVGPRG